MTDLLLCPFCGGINLNYSRNNYVTCDNCDVFGPSNKYPMTAIAAWNTRTPTPATNAGAVKVKPLVWERHPMGWIAAPPTGHSYIIDVRIKGRVIFVKGMNPPPQFSDIESAKSAAQADYDARIMAAIEPTPDPRDAVIARLVEADILKAAGEEYILEHIMETDWHRMGRHSTVRGMMVRLGLYPKLEGAIDAALAATKEVMK